MCSCEACTKASWGCVWCVYDNQCRDTQAACTTGDVSQSDVRKLFHNVTGFTAYHFCVFVFSEKNKQNCFCHNVL